MSTAGALSHFFAAISDMIARPMRSHLGGGQDKEAVIGYWPTAAIGLVRNAGEQWLASPPGPAKPDQEAMARQITDWLCFGIAPELQAPRPRTAHTERRTRQARARRSSGTPAHARELNCQH